MEELKEKLEEIRDQLTDIIPKLEEEWMDSESVTELQEAKNIVWWKIHEINIM